MGKPKLLFVDDRTKRIHYALTEYSPEYDVTIATCVPEALRALSREEWDVVSLDHDLNGHDFEDPDTPTCGMEIVRYIAKTIRSADYWIQQFSRKPPVFWIHSSNLFAAHLMTASLQSMYFEACYKPITYKVEHMQYDEKGLPK